MLNFIKYENWKYNILSVSVETFKNFNDERISDYFLSESSLNFINFINFYYQLFVKETF